MGIMTQKLAGNIVFFDFDGVLTSYQATENKVHIDDEEYVRRHITKQADPFRYARASKIMQGYVSELNKENIYVLSATASSFENENKRKFLDTHYPEFKQENIIFVASSRFKVIVMETLYDEIYKGKYSKDRLIIVEDTIDVIKSVENKGFTSYHISSFLE